MLMAKMLFYGVEISNPIGALPTKIVNDESDSFIANWHHLS